MSCSDSRKSKKRKSCKSGNMGDVLGKECGNGEKGEIPQEIHMEDVREEADGAPSGDEQSSQCSEDTESFNMKRIEELLAEELPNYDIEFPDSAIDSNPDSPILEEAIGRILENPAVFDACKKRKQVAADRDEELQHLTACWMEIREFILKVYRSSLNSRVFHRELDNGVNLKDLVHKLCDRDPHQLFQRLEKVVQDFLIDVKNQLIVAIDREKQTAELAGSYITGLLDRYDSFCWAAGQLSPYFHELDVEYLKQFKISWELFNKHMYMSYVYIDPIIQESLPRYIAKLRSMLPGKNDIYCALVHRYLAFDDEMNTVGSKWKDVEASFIKYNQMQAAFRAKQLRLRRDWEEFKAQRQLEQEKMWTKRELGDLDKRLLSLATLRLRDDCSLHQSCPCEECSLTHLLTCDPVSTPPSSPPDTGVAEGRVAGEGSEQPLPAGGCECYACSAPPPPPECHACVPPPATYPHGGALYPHLYNVHPSLLTQLGPKQVPPTPAPSHHPKMSPLLPQQKQCKQIVDGIVATIANALPKGAVETSGPRPKPTLTRHSTTQTHACKPAAHRKTGHVCHKSHEPVKRAPCADFGDSGVDGCCASEDSSSQDDTCSERSSSTTASTQRDSRHCDCCYCEVFGHGMPTVTPVSRNYPEMRERLRLLLTKKKAKCKSGAVSNGGGKTVPTPDSVPRGKAALTEPVAPLTKHGSLEALLQQQPMKDARDLEALLEFIEGNQSNKCKDSKKAAKRLKQKQKKQEEKEKRDEEEAERERIDAIRTKNPEVTITVVNSPEAAAEPVKTSKRAAKKAAAALAAAAAEAAPPAVAAPQMVTIKRVIESSSAEPTVTITLKGATPDKDKVLFTLVQGGQERYDLPYQNVRYAQDTSQPEKLPAPSQKQKPNSREVNSNARKPQESASIAKNSNIVNGKKGKKEKVKPVPPPSSKPEHSTAKLSNGTKKSVPPPMPVVRDPPPKPVTATPIVNLDDFRLPPGITITKVDGPTPERRPQPRPAAAHETTCAPSSGGGDEVIVVDTGRMRDDLATADDSQGKRKNKKKNKNQDLQLNGHIARQVNDNIVTINKVPSSHMMSTNHRSLPPQQPPFPCYTPNASQAAIIKVNGSMVTIRNPAFHPPMMEGNRFPPPPMTPPEKPAKKVGGAGGAGSGVKGKENYVTTASGARLNGVSISKVSPPSRQEAPPRLRHPAAPKLNGGEFEVAVDDTKKKKKKKKGANAQNSSSESDLVDNVFTPKDIDLENGDIDDDERELEQFKRFCFASKPPEQKEKVHLNIKDLVIKKKGSAIGCS